jgi:hypothetical protein
MLTRIDSFIRSTRLIVIRTIIYLAVFLIIAIPLNGCASTTPTPTASLSASEIRQKVLQKAAAINAYRFEMVMSTHVSLPDKNSIDQQSTIQGSMDKNRQQMKLSLTLSQQIEANRTQKNTASSEVYVSGKEMFQKTSGLGRSEDWQKQSAPDNLWEEQDMIAKQIKMLDTAGIQVKGREKFNGTDCYLLEVTPDIGAVWETLQKQWDLQDMAGDMAPQEMLRDISMQVWVAADTFLPMRVRENMTLAADLAALGGQPAVTGNVSNLKIGIDLTAFDYNQDLHIERPPDLN